MKCQRSKEPAPEKGTDKQPHLHVLAGLDKFAHQTFQLTGPLD